LSSFLTKFAFVFRMFWLDGFHNLSWPRSYGNWIDSNQCNQCL